MSITLRDSTIELRNNSSEYRHGNCSGEGQLHFFSSKIERLLEVEDDQGGMA